MIKVSVIIPTFNRAELVQDAIDSILCQGLTGVEVVIVDDGSTDGTGEALRSRYGDRIHYVYEPNHGRSAARNLGIHLSTGRYLLFLDSDDLLLSGGLAAETAFLDAHPEVDVVYTDGTFCDAAGRDLARFAPARPPHDPGNLLKDLVLSNVILACHSAMVRRTAMDSIGPPYFDEALRGTEDEDIWIRLAALGKTFAYLDLATCKYRVHGSNASRNDPASPAYWERQKSVKRGRFKILHAGFFPGLPAETREQFFHALLVKQLRGDEPARNEAVSSAPFAELPEEVQARLLYHLGVRTILDEGELEAGRRYLRQARKLVPANPKYQGMLMLSRCGRPALRGLFALRQWLRRTTLRDSPQLPIGEGGLQPLSDVQDSI